MKPLVDEKQTYHTVDELDIPGTLRIAVASSVLGTSLVVRVLRKTTVSVHLDEVESTVETTGKLRHVDVESELLVLEVEHLVFRVRGHEVRARSNVLLGRLGHELEREGIARSGDTVSACIVCKLSG